MGFYGLGFSFLGFGVFGFRSWGSGFRLRRVPGLSAQGLGCSKNWMISMAIAIGQRDIPWLLKILHGLGIPQHHKFKTTRQLKPCCVSNMNNAGCRISGFSVAVLQRSRPYYSRDAEADQKHDNLPYRPFLQIYCAVGKALQFCN